MDACTPSVCSCDDFMNFFNDKMKNTRQIITTVNLTADNLITKHVDNNITISDQPLEGLTPILETKLI